MYSECASLTDSIQERALPNIVLLSYPPTVGRDVVRSVLRPLVEPFQSRGEPPEGHAESSSRLLMREQVEWTMEVVGYGLSLPLACHDLITSCIDVYEDWLTALSTPRPSVPLPVVLDPGYYAQIIFSHFQQLFVPRVKSPEIPVHPGPTADPHHTHFNLCRRVLQITHTILMKPCPKLTQETREAISTHILTIADILLSPPVDPSRFSLGSMLSDMLIHVLFEAWLRACATFFPAPHLWKSLRELCLQWRHHRCLAEQWSKLMYSLTLPVLRHLYSPRYLAHLQGPLGEDSDYDKILQSVPPDALVQCWFRMLHTLGNPVELSYAAVFASLPAFQKAASESSDRSVAIPPDLPFIFHEAMRGVARMVYLFLGRQREEALPTESSASSTPLPYRTSPLILRRRDSRENKEKTSVSGGSGGCGLLSTTSTCALTLYISNSVPQQVDPPGPRPAPLCGMLPPQSFPQPPPCCSRALSLTHPPLTSGDQEVSLGNFLMYMY